METDIDTIIVSSYNGGPTELDKTVEAFIADTANEYKEAALNDELDAVSQNPPGDPTTQSPAGTEGTPGPADGVAPPKVDAKPPEDRGVERLVEREVALRARESELIAREQRAAQIESRLKELEARAMPADLQAKWEHDPEEALVAQGQDPEAVVRAVIAKRLAAKNGGKLDPEIRQSMESAKIKKELYELKAQLAEQQRVAQAQAFVARVESEARAYVNKGIGEHAPTVAAVAKANPDRVHREIMEEISRDAAEKMARGSGGDILPYDEAAKRVETRWSEFKSILAPASPPQAPQASTPASKTPAPEAKPTPSSTKTPDRPMAPWLRKSDDMDEGVKAGLAEFKRVEGIR